MNGIIYLSMFRKTGKVDLRISLKISIKLIEN